MMHNDLILDAVFGLTVLRACQSRSVRGKGEPRTLGPDWYFRSSNSPLFAESWRSLKIMDESEKEAAGAIAKVVQWADYFDRRSHGE